jgi:hypothetical protein
MSDALDGARWRTGHHLRDPDHLRALLMITHIAAFFFLARPSGRQVAVAA